MKVLIDLNVVLAVQRCLATFDVLSVNHALLQQAADMAGSDFEDNIQIAAARGAGAALIISRDTSGFSHSEVPVLSPSAFLVLSQPVNPPENPP